jgi:hypothetical protein
MKYAIISDVHGNLPALDLIINDAKSEIREDGHVSVEEKRLPFEMEEYINILRNSDQYKYATVWTKIIEKELRTGFEHLNFFLHFVEDYANKIGDARRPYALDTWETAYALWEVELTKEIRSL